MKKKYILHPGYVTSKNDGDRHFISAPELAKLYNVPLEECYAPNTIGRLDAIENWRGLIHLFPRYDGRYEDYSKKVNNSD